MSRFVSQLNAILSGRQDLLVNDNGLKFELDEQDRLHVYWHLQVHEISDNDIYCYLTISFGDIEAFLGAFNISALSQLMALTPDLLYESYRSGNGNISCLCRSSPDFMHFRYEGGKIMARYEKDQTLDVTAATIDWMSYPVLARKIFTGRVAY